MLWVLGWQFDKTASATLGSSLKNKCNAKGHLSTYNSVDEVRHLTPLPPPPRPGSTSPRALGRPGAVPA